MTLYAYTDQPLAEHTSQTAVYATNYANEDYCEVAHYRFRALDLALKPEWIKDDIALSAVLHDVGKALTRFQGQFNLSVPSYTPRFRFHEVYSAVVADRLCRKLKLGKERRFLVVVSVLQHMYAMPTRGISSGILESVLDVLEPGRVEGFSETDELASMIRQVASQLGVRLDRVDVSLSPISSKDVMKVLNDVKDLMTNRNVGWPKLYVLLLTPIVIGDNLSASERETNENPSRRILLRELKRAMEVP